MSGNQDLMKGTLKRLIEQSNANFNVDDVLAAFRSAKDKGTNAKLLTILKIISKHHPKSHEHLAEVYKLLELKKDPVYCLLYFLNNFSNTNVIQTTATSTPLQLPATKYDSQQKLHEFNAVTAENVSNVKERVAQAVAGLNKSGQTGPLGVVSPVNISKHNFLTTGTGSVFPAINKNTISSLLDFPKIDTVQFQQSNIAAVPLSSQENILLYELIYCLTGIRGTYIIPEETINCQVPEISFKISDQIHSSLRDIAQEILPLASHYLCVKKFLQTANNAGFGQVTQALGAALRGLMHDYYLLLSQLESQLISGNLTIHKLLFYIRPTLNTMEVLADAVSEIIYNELRGGQILSLLYDKINALTGDEESQKFLMQLTQRAAVPYMDILLLWIQKGVINDPYQEFLVEDNEIMNKEELPADYSADYWEKRYTVRQERIPRFLEKVSDMILRTGKYLNVIRQCGKKVSPPQEINLHFTPANQSHLVVIENAYHFASKNLLEVLLKENDLMGHLMSVKRYLLLYQGDFITQFMDACEEELSKNVDKILPMRLENLLGLTIRLSSARNDPYKDDWHCELLTYDLGTQISKILNKENEYWQSQDRLDLYGLECFAFRYDVKWPVSLILNHIAISKYQMLFRQLFYCKHVERQLCRVWKENSTAKRFSPQAAELYRSAFTLRQRMMNAVQNIEYYMMIEVIEPNWHIFIEKMANVENVDDVINVHEDFLDLCIGNCMLTYPHVLRSIIKLCNICLNFCEFIQKAQKHFMDAELTSMLCNSDEDGYESEVEHSNNLQSESSLAPSDTFAERVKRFDLEFTGLLIGLLKQISDVASDNRSDRFINLVHRINFNSFYNDQMEKLCAKDSMVTSHH